MRVISGTARGLKLTAPEGMDTRPTLDRVKEALFSMLTPYIIDAKILDMFAGSGALGIEALSRGGASAVFLDNAKSGEKAVIANLEKARLKDKAVVKNTDALDFLKHTDEKFSLIFIDPPYGGGLYEKALDLIVKRDLLAKDGVIAVEWDMDVHEPVFTQKLVRFKDRSYGRVHITLLTLS